jgi:RES domain-containing protein
MLALDDAHIQHYSQYKDLPTDWDIWPHCIASRAYGPEWVRSNSSVGLTVPSAVVPEEYNTLINMQHPDAANTVKIISAKRYNFDRRKWED